MKNFKMKFPFILAGIAMLGSLPVFAEEAPLEFKSVYYGARANNGGGDNPCAGPTTSKCAEFSFRVYTLKQVTNIDVIMTDEKGEPVSSKTYTTGMSPKSVKEAVLRGLPFNAELVDDDDLAEKDCED